MNNGNNHKSAKIRQIAIYGKGGIGKSTVAGNLTAALSYMDISPAQIGCDPKADSINFLTGTDNIETISDLVAQFGDSKESLLKGVYRGFNNAVCMESGGPMPGQGCAGRGVLCALELIKKHKILEYYGVDFAIYDVLGDIVCGGFAQPVRQGFAKEVYMVTSGEYMSLYAANNIATSIHNFFNSGLDVRIGGIIANFRNTENESKIIENFAKSIGVPIIMTVPRSEFVQRAEIIGKTVIEAFPDSNMAEVYFELGYNILHNRDLFVPKPLSREKLKDLIKSSVKSSAKMP